MTRRVQRALETAPWTLLAWAPMLWWYAAFRPGIMSADSLESWRQATQGGWVDLQPPLYTAAMWVSDVVLASPSLLTLAQSLLLAASIVAVARSVIGLGVDRRLVIAVAAVVAASPMVGAFSVSLWKDIPFAAAMLFVVARLVDVTAGADRDHALVSATAWLALATALRQNGLLVALVVFAALALLRPALRRRAAVGTVVCFGVLAVAKLVAYPILDVAAGPANATVSTFLHDIASVAARDPGALDDGDRDLLEQVAPVDTWAAAWRPFGCASANWQYSSEFDWSRIDGDQRDYLALWAELLVENPRAVVGNRSCAGSVAWRPDAVGVLYTVSRGIDANDLGLRTVPLVGSWNDLAVDVLEDLDDPDMQRLVWRAAGWLYLTYVVVGVAAWRRRRPLLALPLVVPASVQLAVLVLNPAQDARYLMPALVSAWLLLPVAAVPAPRPTTTADEPVVAPIEEVVPT